MGAAPSKLEFCLELFDGGEVPVPIFHSLGLKSVLKNLSVTKSASPRRLLI
jgi:hypothetical protein